MDGEVVSADPVAWLRAQIEEDGRKAARRLRRASSDAFRRQVMEKLARAKAELAILDEHGPTDWTAYGDHMCRRCHRPREEAREDEDQCEWLAYPCRTIRLVFGAYRYRSGYDEKWEITPAGTAPGLSASAG